MRGIIARLLQRRDKPILLGLCEGCRTKVFHDDEYERTPLGYAHRECARYQTRTGVRPPGRGRRLHA